VANRPPITILICTRGRPAQLEDCINSAIGGARGWPLHIVVGFDDDPQNYIQFRESIEKTSDLPLGTKVGAIGLTPRHYYVRAVNALFAWARGNVPHFDYFVLSNDDVTWAPDWAKHAFYGLNKSYPRGLGICELSAPDACAHYISRAQFFVETFDGVLAEPCYTFYFSDRELLNRAKLLGRYRYLRGPEGPLIAHDQQRDAVRSEVERWWSGDETTFFMRRTQPVNQEWPDDGVPRKVWLEVFGGQ
jgi:glycosyltransferase involved in cell wall biosynthesis